MSLKEWTAHALALSLAAAGKLALWCGRVEVIGRGPAEKILEKGGVLIVANHPSLAEAVVLPSLFWHWGFEKRATKVPWSVADVKLFRYRLWLFPAFRCIPVSRNDPTAYPTAKAIWRRLKRGGNVIVYPEGGRTAKGERFIEAGQRRVRYCNPAPLRVAASAKALVLPVWISFRETADSGSLFRDYLALWLGRGMKITFGPPIRIYERLDERDVASLLLSNGQGEQTQDRR